MFGKDDSTKILFSSSLKSESKPLDKIFKFSKPDSYNFSDSYTSIENPLFSFGLCNNDLLNIQNRKKITCLRLRCNISLLKQAEYEMIKEKEENENIFKNILNRISQSPYGTGIL